MKANIKNLAINGGQPAFSEVLHVNKPRTGDREKFLNLTNTILNSGIYTNNGRLVIELEEKLANFLNVKHCLLTTNGTLAMSLLIQALGLKREVILPSFNFISTAHTLMWQGIKPIFCDIDPMTWNIDPDCCEKLITDQTTAIIATHTWGRSCNIERLESIALKNNIKLIFDAAHAFGSTYQGASIGGFGDAEVFSFHATKFFHTFEGGAVTTNNSNLAEKLMQMRNFGFAGYDEVVSLGTNAKMTEICAAMGLSNLSSVDDRIYENEELYQTYYENLFDVTGISVIKYDDSDKYNHQYIVIEINQDEIGLSRDQIMKILHAENILVRRYFYPGNHKMEPYNSLYPSVDNRLANTNKASKGVLVLPSGGGIDKSQIRTICSLLKYIVASAVDLQNL